MGKKIGRSKDLECYKAKFSKNIDLKNAEHKCDFDILFKYGLIVFSIFLLLIFTAVIKPQIYGDGFEYTYIMQAFDNHLSPDVNYKDISDAQVILKNNGISQFPNMHSGFFKSYSGKMYSYHFWLYPFLCFLVKLLLKFLGLNQFRAFQITNVILFLASLWIVYYYMNIDKKKKYAFISLLSINPIIWYLIWTHPEVFCYSLVVMSIAMYTRNKFKMAMMFSAIASMQNPPLLILNAIYLFKYYKMYHNNISLRESLLALLSCFPIVVPSIFYYINFGTLNLITKSGGAGIKYITFQKVYDQIFDFNMGLFPYFPLIIVLMMIFIIKDIIHKNFKGLILPFAILMIIVLSDQTNNWNSDCSGIMRYNTWLIPIILYYIVSKIDLHKKIHKDILIASFIFQIIIISICGGLICRLSYVKFNPAVKLVLNNFPWLYSPEYETFAERTLGTETNYIDRIPIVYSSNGNVTKILTDYNGFKKSEGEFDIKDSVYLNKAKDNLKKNDNKVKYVNFRKGVIKLKEDTILQSKEDFKSSIQLIGDSNKTVKPSESFATQFVIINKSGKTWINKNISSGKYIAVAYHVLDSKGNMINYDGMRTILPAIINPDEQINIKANAIAPEKSGKYVLEFDLLQEQVSWFKDKENKTVKVFLDVK